MTIDELTPSNITKSPQSYVAGEAELETIAMPSRMARS